MPLGVAPQKKKTKKAKQILNTSPQCRPFIEVGSLGAGLGVVGVGVAVGLGEVCEEGTGEGPRKGQKRPAEKGMEIKGGALPLTAQSFITDKILAVFVDGIVGQMHADILLGRQRERHLGPQVSVPLSSPPCLCPLHPAPSS